MNKLLVILGKLSFESLASFLVHLALAHIVFVQILEEWFGGEPCAIIATWEERVILIHGSGRSLSLLLICIIFRKLFNPCKSESFFKKKVLCEMNFKRGGSGQKEEDKMGTVAWKIQKDR